MTITSTLIAPIVTPLLILYIGGAWVDVQVLPMMITMVKVIIVPILLGAAIQYVCKSHINTLTSISPIFSMIAIILLIAAIIAINKDKLFVSGLETLIVVGISIHSVEELDRKSTRLNSSHRSLSRMPSSA